MPLNTLWHLPLCPSPQLNKSTLWGSGRRWPVSWCVSGGTCTCIDGTLHCRLTTRPSQPCLLQLYWAQTTEHLPLVGEASAIQLHHSAYSWQKTCSLGLPSTPHQSLAQMGLNQSSSIYSKLHSRPQFPSRTSSLHQHRTPHSPSSALLSRRGGCQKFERS